MDWATIDFSGLTDDLFAVVKIVIPTVLTFIGFRKGYAFLKKQVKGA